MTQKQTIVFGKQCWPVLPGLKFQNLVFGYFAGRSGAGCNLQGVGHSLRGVGCEILSLISEL